MTSLPIYSLPDKHFLDWSNSKAFADKKIIVTKEMKFVLRRVENKGVHGKGENVGCQHFLLFPQFFQQKFYFSRLLQIRFVRERAKNNFIL